MENEAYVNPMNGCHGDIFVKLGCSGVEFNQQSFLNPVKDQKVQASEGIQDWQSSRVHQNAP